jgi:hypothetical protein
MSATTPGVRRHGADGRFEALAEKVRTVRSRGRAGRADIWMLYVGGALMPLGALLIVLGWLGASRTPFVFEQTPYLISGGLLGLALVIGGGFVYFGYWQSLRIRESRRQAEDLTAAVARLETLLGNGTGVGGGVGGARFVATAQGSIFHRPDCAVVDGRSNLRKVNPDREDLAPCQICDPLSDKS